MEPFHLEMFRRLSEQLSELARVAAYAQIQACDAKLRMKTAPFLFERLRRNECAFNLRCISLKYISKLICSNRRSESSGLPEYGQTARVYFVSLCYRKAPVIMTGAFHVFFIVERYQKPNQAQSEQIWAKMDSSILRAHILKLKTRRHVLFYWASAYAAVRVSLNGTALQAALFKTTL